MNLSKFISLIGHLKLAKILKVTPNAVLSWKKYMSVPRPTTAFELISLSHETLTWESIYEPYVKKHLKGKSIRAGSKDGVQMEFKF